MNTNGFLTDHVDRIWTLDPEYKFSPIGLFVGSGTNAIEVAVATTNSAPARLTLLKSWRDRRGKRAAPVLIVILYPGGAALCGATGDQPPVYSDLDTNRVERLCRGVLSQPDRHAALRYLSRTLPSLETDLPGINNEGLLANHELHRGVPAMTGWEQAGKNAAAVIGKFGEDLLNVLGFQIEQIDNLTKLLRGGHRRTSLAVLLHEEESPETMNDRFNNLSPVSYAFKKADDESLPWVIIIQGSRIRLYSTDTNAGVGRRGRTETYVECYPSLLSNEQYPYLWMLYSAEALAPEGSLYQILNNSRRFAGDLAKRLRERIYDDIVPGLAQGIAAKRGIIKPTKEDLTFTYEMALTVLFRLLFIAYAEDRDLLPFRSNDAYRRRSLKQKAQELAECVNNGTPIANGNSHWLETELLWTAIAEGNSEWCVPAYNGSLFSRDSGVSSVGAMLAKIMLPNEIFETVLRQLLVIETAEGTFGPVDFRSLGVREFGTIYEGLLESELAVADTDLILGRKGVYKPVSGPVSGKKSIAVSQGEVYLHNRSGARKATGSYYTKPFAVEHLLDGTLEPSLDDHFVRLDKMDDADAAESFFDFRVADISMGSGHFLIGAIDRIEKRMAHWLAGRSLSGVRRELATLRNIAQKRLGESASSSNIEDSQLLRRLIARRCIYGVDINSLSVHLARLAVWIHTFVPGLPLSFLDHNLVHGNALVGVGSIDEIEKVIKLSEGTLLEGDADSWLGAAKKPLQRLANINDATLADIELARKAVQEVQAAVTDTEGLCNLITVLPISNNWRITHFNFVDWENNVRNSKTLNAVIAAKKELEGLHAFHFPIAFPEVFLRKRPGFDVILGNPPWQEATVEEHAFWARHYPGLRGLSQRVQEEEKDRLRKSRPDLVEAFETERWEMEQVRNVLVSGNYPGMGTGDPDLYKAFYWRFWHLTAADGGRIGVVLPRSALIAKGSTEFRKALLRRSVLVDVTMLLNHAGWVFDDAHHQYTIGLVCITRGVSEYKSVQMRGPFASKSTFHQEVKKPAENFDSDAVLAWNDSASLPLLPDPESVNIFAQIRKAPRLDLNHTEPGGGNMAFPPRPRNGRYASKGVHDLRTTQPQWRARPHTELHATAEKKLMTFTKENNARYWPVYKGESFDLWNPDTGVYYAWADPAPLLNWLQSKRMRGANNKRSPHHEFQKKYLSNQTTLPCFAPRIAFRDSTNRTNQRTVIACLVPPRVFIANQAPYLLWPHGDEKDQAYLLGVLCSIPLDWYARRYVETHVSFFIFNPFPIPRPRRDDRFWQRTVMLAGRLASSDDRFSNWAETVGVACGPLAEDEKFDMIHELDAVVARLYGLDERQLIHIFKTFHKGWDFSERLDGVLRHYRCLHS